MKQLHAAAAGVTAPALGRDPASMSAHLLQSLQAMRPKIRARWEALLRIERLHTPLANPDTLVFMFDLTLDEVLAALPGRAVHSPGPRPTCRNHHNPMRDYFPGPHPRAGRGTRAEIPPPLGDGGRARRGGHRTVLYPAPNCPAGNGRL
ncbi:MAG: hypothetical protein NT173_14495 [Opitutales bacterium]|nr:hypothetical protein [Opitutales bacterium]